MNSGKQKGSGTWVVLIVIAAFAWSVWPTPYAPVRENGIVVAGKRVNRLTGRVQVRINERLWVDEQGFKDLASQLSSPR